ncbi:MAG: helix-turn-helix domain-containing protein [Kiloniellales bacterium]|jgi:transcriptional regulator with XRE-family HTH domain|nr:helix-turn-helix domain-containing protein [Kiloniellales bacterium]
MTPFGQRLRELRRERGLSAKDMAAGLGVSAAYLSALEHGRRGMPNKRFVHRVCQYFGIIWDEAEALQAIAALSHPRVVVETAGLSPAATELANRLARQIAELPEETVARWLAELREGQGARPGTRSGARPDGAPGSEATE